MTDCKFKLGETYCDREGGKWILAAHNPEQERPLIFRAEHNPGMVVTRYINGANYKVATCIGDILPHTKKEWGVWYVDKLEGPQFEWYSQYDHAMREITRMLNLPETYSQVRGPFKWEEPV